MFPEPRQRWVDDLALSGAELAAIGVPVLLVHGRDDRVVPWRVSSAQLVDLLPDSRLHVLSGCGHWTMIEKTADPAGAEEDVERHRAECRAVDAALEGAKLDDTFTFGEKTTSVRWMWQHLVEEYARHNGHADLIREAIDGSAGL